MEVIQDHDEVSSCWNTTHERPDYKRLVTRDTVGLWVLACGHSASRGNLYHCDVCGATFIQCPSCAELGRGGAQ